MGESIAGADTRAYVARVLLGPEDDGEATKIGSVVLRPHQKSAVGRLQSAIREFGGAVLCDQVGMGKTYVALALTDRAETVRVVAPAVLRDMWIRAGEAAARTIEFISMESLSRMGTSVGPSSLAEFDDKLLIVDEAHHFRNPATKRYDALAALAARRRVLLLTATPIHNKRSDLAAILALFLGSYSNELSASDLARLVVRRETHKLGKCDLPEVATPQFQEIAHDDDVPQMLLDLPPPLPPRNGGDGGALVAHSLIRQWASSDAALQRALVRRLQRAESLIAALQSGTYPSLSELSAWSAGEDCVQLAFAELIAPRSDVAADLIATVSAHADALSSVLKLLKSRASCDEQRAEIVRSIRCRHAGLGIVAFSQYSDTVDALFRLLAPDGQVAALTGRSARISSGRISRSNVIALFAPVASGTSVPRKSEVVTLLLSTDLLSEGVNLQDAAIVVHLDFPWTPAKMEQRLGRVARMGSRHERVFSYALRPPASAETLIRIEHTLREKISASGIVVDQFESLAAFPMVRGAVEASAPRMTEEIREILESWSRAGDRRSLSSAPPASTLTANVHGFLALCAVSGRRFLVGCDDDGISTDPARILRLLRMCGGSELPSDVAGDTEARRMITRYFDGLSVMESSNRSLAAMTADRRSALNRIAQITSRSRPYERQRIAAIAAEARSSLLSRIGAYGERRLANLAAAKIPDEDWMRSVAELGNPPSSSLQRTEVLAVLLLRSETVSDARERCRELR